MSHSPDADDSAPRYTVAVRELCGFAARTGDLDLRFTPAPTAAEGIAGHQSVVARRAAHYQAEVSLVGRHRHLHVRGRADGYDAERPALEEIKTHKGDVDAIPDNHRALHWAQAKVYASMLCAHHGLPAIDVVLVYWHVGQLRETRLTEHCSAAQLQAFFADLCDRFIAWADQELAHRADRDHALRALAFPHAAMRAGQRVLAEQTWRCARAGRPLLAQAPTGIGKTLGTLFPLLKAAAGREGNAIRMGAGDEGAQRGQGSAPEPIAPYGPRTGRTPQVFDKLFYLSAKGSARAMAVEAVRTLSAASANGRLPLRVLELVARDDACVHPDKACHGDSCPLAQGFFDRLPQARQAAVLPDRAGAAQPLQWSGPGVRALADQHAVCPYYLSQELVRWADVVVGDVNYWFDTSALLHGLQQLNGWRVALLIDEAHNLLDRARGMYSAALQQADVRHLHKHGPPPLRKAFGRLNRAWQALVKHADGQCDADVEGSVAGGKRLGDGESALSAGAAGLAAGAVGAVGAARAAPGTDDALQVLDELPVDWARALVDLNAAIGEYLSDGEAGPPGPVDGGGARGGPDAGVADDGSAASQAGTGAPAAAGSDRRRGPPPTDPELMRFYFDALQFARLLETFGDHSMLALTRPPAALRRLSRGGQTEIAIRNLLPAPFLRPRFQAAAASVLFSATLQPPRFHQDTLGLDEDLAWLDVEAPFQAEQLKVHLVPGISTRWRHRQRSVAPIVRLMVAAWHERPGNYLAFFSSFDYMGQVADALAEAHPGVPQCRQSRRMSAAERQAFLDGFGPDTRQIGFAVLGGQFGEGIDLPGRRLIGAFIATLGLPQFNAYNEQVRKRMQAAFGEGHAYTYLYPGLRKVVQAAGRVIRTPEDEGAVWLIDDRFASSEVRALLPRWWRPVRG